MFADSLFTRYRAAFGGGDDLLAHLLALGNQGFELLPNRIVELQLRRALGEFVAHAVDAFHVEGHITEEIVYAHDRVEILLAVFDGKFRARVRAHNEWSGIGFRAARHLYG